MIVYLKTVLFLVLFSSFSYGSDCSCCKIDDSFEKQFQDFLARYNISYFNSIQPATDVGIGKDDFKFVFHMVQAAFEIREPFSREYDYLNSLCCIQDEYKTSVSFTSVNDLLSVIRMKCPSFGFQKPCWFLSRNFDMDVMPAEAWLKTLAKAFSQHGIEHLSLYSKARSLDFVESLRAYAGLKSVINMSEVKKPSKFFEVLTKVKNDFTDSHAGHCSPDCILNNQAYLDELNKLIEQWGEVNNNNPKRDDRTKDSECLLVAMPLSYDSATPDPMYTESDWAEAFERVKEWHSSHNGPLVYIGRLVKREECKILEGNCEYGECNEFFSDHDLTDYLYENYDVEEISGHPDFGYKSYDRDDQKIFFMTKKSDGQD